MRFLHFHGFGMYLNAWLLAWGSHARRLVPLTPHRLLFLLLSFPAFLALTLMHFLAWTLDDLLFPGYRNVHVEKPLFISGLPRSGTTFLHRTLTETLPGFTSFSTWETVLAPAVLEKKIIALGARMDQMLGSPVRRLLLRWIDSSSGEMAQIHAIGPDQAEEDYLSLLAVGGCFLLFLAFPHSAALQQTGSLKRMKPGRRDALLHHYHQCIQKHLFHHGLSRPFLSKNAAWASWLPDLADRYPDGKFLVAVREPLSALSSQISSLKGIRTVFGTPPDTYRFQNIMFRLFESHFDACRDFLTSQSPDRAALITQDDLKANPGQCIVHALDQLGIQIEKSTAERLRQLPTYSGSGHQHSGSSLRISRSKIENCLQPVYLQLCRHPHRVR